MSQSQQEFKDRMASRLQNVLARLAHSAATHQPTVPTVGPRPAPNDKIMVRDFPQTDRDQVNDPTSSTSEVTMVSVAPSPPVADVHPTQIDTPILSDVPLVRARRAEGFDHTVGVQSTLAGIDGAKVHFSNVVKQANTNLRSEGDLAANIAITLGQDATEAQEATVTAVSGRIATARMAVRKGATASRVPLAGMDVRLSVLRTVAADERAWPDHTPVYIPSGMSDAGAAALVSLLVDGGPGAYVWRYPGGVADAAAQPSGVRWQWPGGTNRLLVVTENDRDWNVVFGGQSFTESALMEVEDHYRRAWGDGIFDEGWRTAFSLYGVYFSPKDLDLPVGLDFDAKQVRQDETIDGRSVDFDFEWAGPSDIPDPPDDNTRGIFTSLPPSYTAQLGAPTYRAWVDAFGDRFGDDRPDPLQYASYSAEARGIYYVDQGGKRWLAEWEHLTDEAMEDEGLLLVTRRARQIYLRVAFGDGLRNPDEAPPFDPQQTLVRNVFGQNDRATLLLPRLRLVSVLALLSGISVTVPGRTVERWLDNGNMDVISKAFGAHQHFAFIYSLSAQMLDPGTLRALPTPGAVGMLGVPPELRSACVPRMMSELEYPWGSHECLENGGIFQTFRNTPFAGFAVEGTWNASGGYVKVADPGNSYPAIDAAARATWANGGTIDVHTRLRAGVSLSVVFSLEKLPNPFGVPRFVQGVRGVEPLTVQSGAGVNTLLAGRSMDPFLWATW